MRDIYLPLTSLTIQSSAGKTSLALESYTFAKRLAYHFQTWQVYNTRDSFRRRGRIFAEWSPPSIKTWRKKLVISWYFFSKHTVVQHFLVDKRAFFSPTLESWRMADSVLDHVCYICRRNVSLLSVDVGRVAAMGDRPWGSEKRRQRGITHGRAKLNVFKCTSLRKNSTFLGAVAGILVKWRPLKRADISYWWRVTTLMWVVFLIGWKFALTN